MARWVPTEGVYSLIAYAPMKMLGWGEALLILEDMAIQGKLDRELVCLFKESKV